MKNFKIVLFKNKKKKRIIKEYSKEEYALNKFNDLLKSQDIPFERMYENNNMVRYELALVNSDSTIQPNLYNSDVYGRWDKVFISNSTNHTILKIEDYKIEEKIFDHLLSKRISFYDIINVYLKKDNLKVISILNNKLVIQNEDKFSLFSLKNSDESKRLLWTIENFFISEGRNDCMFITDESSSHKKWMYDTLSKNGFNKKSLYKTKTNF